MVNTHSPTSFQFTPLREGRRQLLPCLALPFHFNSRPSARGDFFGIKSNLNQAISIHAPPRGATAIKAFSLSDVDIFQFTPLREGRPRRRSRWKHLRQFQFTPLREGRLCGTSRVRAVIHFNSRPSARGDVRRRHARAQVLSISIHAPPRGATASNKAMAIAYKISIHAPPRGATSYCPAKNWNS